MTTRTLTYPRKCPSCATRLRFGEHTATEKGQTVFTCPGCKQKFQPRYQLYPLKNFLLLAVAVPLAAIFPSFVGFVAALVAGFWVLYWAFGLEVSQ
jgi:hypothetical protein